MVWPIDLQSEAQKAIYKIFIPYGVYKELNEILDTLDINNNTIYGESNLDVASKEIRAKATIAFSNEIERLSQKFKVIPSPSVF